MGTLFHFSAQVSPCFFFLFMHKQFFKIKIFDIVIWGLYFTQKGENSKCGINFFSEKLIRIFTSWSKMRHIEIERDGTYILYFIHRWKFDPTDGYWKEAFVQHNADLKHIIYVEFASWMVWSSYAAADRISPQRSNRRIFYGFLYHLIPYFYVFTWLPCTAERERARSEAIRIYLEHIDVSQDVRTKVAPSIPPMPGEKIFLLEVIGFASKRLSHEGYQEWVEWVNIWGETRILIS